MATPKQLINSTIAVIVIVLITSAIVFVLDLAFDGMNNYGINKIKAKLVNETSEVSEAIVDNTVENEIREESTAE